ncbi:hypothetical protein B0H13DRAFT_2429886 [Mycena leptocephala]|nr:hypothetical protein B0H13DRAFT_2429886 [Mycena leptocephala]
MATCSLVHCVNASCVLRSRKQEEGWGQSTQIAITLTTMSSGVGLAPARLPALASLFPSPILRKPKALILENVEMNTVTAPYCAGHRPVSAPAPVPLPISAQAPSLLPVSAPAPALRWHGSFLDDLASVTRDFGPPRNTIMYNTQDQRFRTSHPHWFRSPSPPVVPLSPFPISLVLVDFARQGKPAITQTIKAYSWNWIRPGNQPYEVYSIDYFQWMLVPSGYVHDLHRRRRLLIRSRGVTSSDEDAQIAMLRTLHV